jgi:hypothetical protein
MFCRPRYERPPILKLRGHMPNARTRRADRCPLRNPAWLANCFMLNVSMNYIVEFAETGRVAIGVPKAAILQNSDRIEFLRTNGR